MITESQIKKLVAEKIEGTDTFIVEVVVKPGNKISILVDNDKGLSIKDCVSISRHVESSLDRETEDFELQVSSPGLDQPLKNVRQFKKHVGKQVNVITSEGNKITGLLKDADDESIEIEERSKEKVEGKKSKQLVIRNTRLPYSKLKETRILISF
jgi:ribosome maturation factor RimP